MSSLDKNSVDRALEHFLRRIILTKTQHDRAIGAITWITTTIGDSESCPNGAKIYEQGSFATRTILKPDVKRVATAEFDVDIAVESSQWDGSDAQSALNTIHSILTDSGISEARLKIKKSCVRITYADGPAGEKFHVDVVPLWNNFGTIRAPKCTDTENTWIESDPGKLTRWFNNKATAEPTFRAQYLLMKRFAQMNNIKVPSIAIQKITADTYAFKQFNSRYLRELLDMCRLAVQNLESQSYQLTNPVNPGEDLRPRIKDGELERYTALLKKVVSAIERFSTDGTYADVVDLFGDLFPKKESHEQELSLRAHGIYFDCDFADRVSLSATAKNGVVEGGGYRLTVDKEHENYKGSPSVDKIRLTVSNLPEHHTTKWQVMNDPKEVPFQIRGNFEDPNEDPSANAEHRSESVSYAGKHFVRAFIVKGNRYKAVSHRFDVNVIRALA